MTNENKRRLLRAYSATVAAGMDEIAEMLLDVILGEMGQEKTVTLRNAQEVSPLDNMPLIPPYGNRNVVTCDGTRAEWTGTDHLSKEATCSCTNGSDTETFSRDWS